VLARLRIAQQITIAGLRSTPPSSYATRARAGLAREIRLIDSGVAPRFRPDRARFENDLTVILPCAYITSVESSFAIVAEPNRRAILSLLLRAECSVGEIERELRLSQPSVSKHLRVLREAGFVESRIEAQRRLYRLRPEPLMELDAWLLPFRRFWSKHVDALEQHLDRLDKVVPPEKGKKKHGQP
jgi:DNA-binding transcriptional ArsR family regulator